ncbi:MAG: ComEC/Rec2 family competence protein [Chloroflexota bacterium]
MIPFGSRVGIGAIAVGLAAVSAGVPLAALVALAAMGTAAIVLPGLGAGGGRMRRAKSGRTRRASVGVLVGAWLVIGRLVIAGDAEPPLSLPPGAGPWAARVVAMSSPRDGQQRLTVELDEPSGVLLAVTAPRYPVVEPGDAVRVEGRPAAPPEGGYGEFLRRTGVAGTLRTGTLALVAHGRDAAALLERVRRAAGDSIARALPEPAAGLAAGILVGLRDRVDRDLAAAFTATGLSHVVAISGWNIALVAGLVGAMLAGRARRTRSGVILVAIVVYTVLAGASASVVRAAAMTGVALMAREAGRPGTAAAALGWAVAGLVVANPASAADVGLQLSAAATAGLIAWSAPITAVLDRRVAWAPRWIREGLGVSLAAQAATLPLVLVAFGRVAPLSPATNLAVVPLVPLAMATGTVALVGGALAAFGGPAIAAPILGIPGALVLGLLIGIVRLAAALPLASVTLPPAVAAAAAALVVAVLAMVAARRGARRARATLHAPPRGMAPPQGMAPKSGDGRPPGRPAAGHPPRASRSTRALRLAGLLGALAVAVLVVAGATRPDGRVHVVVLDVGQGDAILVTGPTGGRMLVDGGPDADRLLVALDARLPPWDRRIDIVVLTHPHEDHVAGLPLVLERYRVGRVVEPGMPGRSPGYEALAAILAATGVTSGRLAAGDRFAFDGIGFAVLWPDARRVPTEASDDGSEVNDASIVLLGSFEGRRFLLAGDAEAEVEAELVSRGLPTVDLLKVGHHGSRTSTSEAMVAATRPRVAAVSVGARNDYGHPSHEVIERLENAGAVVVRTDRVRTIDVGLSAAGMEVRTERPAPRGEAGASPAARRPDARDGPGALAGLPYDRPDARSFARGRRRPPRLARASLVAPAPRARRRGDRGMARGALRGPRRRRGSGARGSGRAPPRRRQGDPFLGPGGRPAARRGLGRLARRTRDGRARAGGGIAPGDAPARCRGRCLAGVRSRRGAPGRLRGQARGPAAGVAQRALRRLAAALPGRLVGR